MYILIIQLQNEHSKPQKLRFNKYILLLLLGVQCCAPSIMHSQSNLVVNADVELYDTCPDNTGQIYRANGWWQYSISTIDYMNVCSSNLTVTTFLPMGGERYLAIGAFLDTSLIKLEFAGDILNTHEQL